MKINILVKGDFKDSRYEETLLATQSFYKDRGIKVVFDEIDGNIGYHIHLNISDQPKGLFSRKYTKLNSGGAGEMGESKKNKDNGHYPIWLKFGLDNYKGITSGSVSNILIHEILHCFYYEFGLRNIHDLELLPAWVISDPQRSAENWGRLFSLDRYGANTPDKVIVHHSLTSNKSDNDQYNAIKRYHINKKEWDDIAYHYLIEPSGKIKIGRWENKEGTHTKGENTTSLGICLVGNFDIENPTISQKDSLKWLLKNLAFKYIFPHRKYANKSCYGSKLSDTWARDLLLTKKEDMEYIIIGNKTQYILIPSIKAAFSIGEISAINKLKETGLGKPVSQHQSYINGYTILTANSQDLLRDLFNL